MSNRFEHAVLIPTRCHDLGCSYESQRTTAAESFLDSRFVILIFIIIYAITPMLSY